MTLDRASGSTTCEICRKEFSKGELNTVSPATLTDQSETMQLCTTCRVVYDHRPTDNECLACGVPTELAAEGYAFTIEFPVTETPDGPTAELSGELCTDCASRIGTEVLLAGVHGERERHERLMQALIERDHPLKGESVDSTVERTTDEAG